MESGAVAAGLDSDDVANALFRAGMIEAWGRGIERIIEACREASTPEPEFRYEQNGLWVVFTFGNVEMPVPGTIRKTREKTREKILARMAANPLITIEELAGHLGITVKGVEWQINKLKQAGRLQRIGPAKGGYWHITETSKGTKNNEEKE